MNRLFKFAALSSFLLLMGGIQSPVKVTLVGDSMFVYMQNHAPLDPALYNQIGICWKHDAISGFTIQNSKAMLTAIYPTPHQDTERIVIMLGTNDALQFKTAASMNTWMVSHIQNCHVKWPNAQVIVLGIPPLLNRPTEQGIIDQANALFASSVPQNSAEWYDAWPDGAPVPADYQADGIHFQPSGSLKLRARVYAALAP